MAGRRVDGDAGERHHLGGDQRGHRERDAERRRLPDRARPTCRRGPRTARSTPARPGSSARPRALGFSAQRMAAIARDAKPSQTTCLLVARKGKVVGEWNWRGRRARDPARGVLGDQVDHQHPGRDGAGRRRPRHRRPGQALHRGMAGHQVTRGHHPRHPQQRQRPLLGRRHRLRRPAPGRGPHPVRDRPGAAVPARPRSGPTTTPPSRPSTG